MGRIQNRVPVRVWPVSDPGIAGRVRNAIPWLVDVVDTVEEADITNRIPMNVIEVDTYPRPVHNAQPIKVYLDPDAGSLSYLGNAEPVAVYVVSGSLALCPSASTVDENGDVSRQHVTLCFCDAIQQPEEGNLWDNWTLSVNEDTTTWTFTSVTGTDGDKCLTFAVSGGPLSYGDTLIAIYDHSGPSPWVSLEDDLSINVSNTIPGTAYSLTLDSDALSLSGDVTDYVAYIKADSFRSALNAESNNIEFKQGTTTLDHECVRRTRFFHHGAVYSNAGVKPIVASGKMLGTAVGCPSDAGIYIYCIDLTTYEKTEFKLSTTGGDDHAPGGIFISSTGYITAFWSFHGSDNYLRYRTSTNPYDVSAWGTEQTLDVGAATSYAMVSPLQADTQKCIVICRGNDWEYTATTNDGSSWSTPQQVFNSIVGHGGSYPWISERPGSDYVFDVVATTYGSGAGDNELVHLVLTFDSDLAGFSWEKADGTPIAGIADPADGDVIFAAGDATGTQDIRIQAMEYVDGDLYVLATIHPVTGTTPAEYWRLVYDGVSWTKTKILDTTHNMILPQDVKGMPGLDFDLIGDPNCNTVFAIDGAHPDGNYGYTFKKMTFNGSVWSVAEIIVDNPYYDAGGFYSMWKIMQPRGWRGESTAAAKFFKAIYMNGYIPYIHTHNTGLMCWPGVPDAFYVKVPTLSSGSDTEITAVAGYSSDTGQEDRAEVWSDYKMVMHGGQYPAGHQLVNSVYADADSDPSAIEWNMTSTADGRLMFTDSPLHGSAPLEPGSNAVSSYPLITDPWVSADEINFNGVSDWTIEFFAKTDMDTTHSTYHCMFDQLTGGTGVASVLIGISVDGSGVAGDLNFGVRSVNGWHDGLLNGVSAGLVLKDTWQHCAFVYNGTLINGYVDAELAGTDTRPDGGMIAADTVGPMSFMNRIQSGDNFPWSGSTAEFRISFQSSVDRSLATAANLSDYDNFVTVE